MRLPADLEQKICEYENGRGLPPTVGSGDKIRQWVMKQYREGVEEFRLDSWPYEACVYDKDGDTYVCGYKVFDPFKLVSDLQFQANYGLLCDEYSRLTTTRGNARG